MFYNFIGFILLICSYSIFWWLFSLWATSPQSTIHKLWKLQIFSNFPIFLTYPLLDNCSVSDSPSARWRTPALCGSSLARAMVGAGGAANTATCDCCGLVLTMNRQLGPHLWLWHHGGVTLARSHVEGDIWLVLNNGNQKQWSTRKCLIECTI